ncbi:MAG: hypothetical protein AAF138_09680 [Planctomycetota bacterium]
MIASVRMVGLTRRSAHDARWLAFRDGLERADVPGVKLLTCERALWVTSGWERGVPSRSAPEIVGVSAARRMLRIAAGLESRLAGETAILGQVREAWACAERAGALDPTLRALGVRAVRAGRLARRVEGFGDAGTGHADEAARWVARFAKGYGLTRPVAGVIGTGAAALAFGCAATRLGARVIAFSRHPERASAEAHRVFDAVRPLDELAHWQPRCDAIVSATRARTPVMRLEQLAGRSRPLLVLDLGAPASITGRLPAGTERLVKVADLDAIAGRSVVAVRAREEAEGVCERQLALLRRDVGRRAGRSLHRRHARWLEATA